MAAPSGIRTSEGKMISVPSADPVGALVPHTLREPLPGAASGPLAGLSFMVKDLFAIAGRKVSNGNPDFYEHAAPAHAVVIHEGGRVAMLGTNLRDQPLEIGVLRQQRLGHC